LKTTYNKGELTEKPNSRKSEPLNHLKSGLLKTGSNDTTKTAKELIETRLMKNYLATKVKVSKRLIVTENWTACIKVLNGRNGASKDENSDSSIIKLG
jgi:hypothetical protein